MFDRVLDVLFPRVCAACGRGAWPFCETCWRVVGRLIPPWCSRCARPLDRPADGCVDCPPRPVAVARAPFLYEGPVRRMLMQFKFAGQRSEADALAPFMAGMFERGPPFVPQPAWTARGHRFEAVVLTWVPLGQGRRRTRGFDQAEVLARAVGRLVGAPVRRLLARMVETDPQARRPGPARRHAMRGAFAPVGRAPPAVVLIDDVLTSGSTAGACAEALIAGGAETVAVLTAARSLGGPLPARCYNRQGSGLGLWLPGERLR